MRTAIPAWKIMFLQMYVPYHVINDDKGEIFALFRMIHMLF